jgi:hypothetical protein
MVCSGVGWRWGSFDVGCPEYKFFILYTMAWNINWELEFRFDELIAYFLY